MIHLIYIPIIIALAITIVYLYLKEDKVTCEVYCEEDCKESKEKATKQPRAFKGITVEEEKTSKKSKLSEDETI